MPRGCVPWGCVPRGCLPAQRVSAKEAVYLGGCLPRGVCLGAVYTGGCLPRECLARGTVCLRGCLPGGVSPEGVSLPRGVSAQRRYLLRGDCMGCTPPVSRITDRCKHITLLQLRCGL